MKNKPKILLVSPFSGTVGGVLRWTQHIVEYHNSLLHKSVDLDLCDVHRTYKVYANTPKLKRLFIGILDYKMILNKYKRKLKESKYDAIHITSSASFGLIKDLLMLNYAKKKQIKKIIHFRFGRIPELYKTNNWETKLLHKVILIADKVIVIDEASYTTLINQGYKNIELLPNPLSPKVKEIVDKNKSIKKEGCKILFVGHVLESKGVFELVEVCKEMPNIQLKILGAVSKEMKQKVLSVAGESHHNWLDIAGEYEYEETIKEMLSAGIFVLPTYTEGFPNVILESMACACPIVASEVGAIPEMLAIKDTTNFGLCVEPKNKIQLKEAIIKMLEDRSFAINCGLNAQKRVYEEYSMTTVWSKLKQIWLSSQNKKYVKL